MYAPARLGAIDLSKWKDALEQALRVGGQAAYDALLAEIQQTEEYRAAERRAMEKRIQDFGQQYGGLMLIGGMIALLIAMGNR